MVRVTFPGTDREMNNAVRICQKDFLKGGIIYYTYVVVVVLHRNVTNVTEHKRSIDK